MAIESKKCAYDLCKCMVAGDVEYCSEHCEDAADQDIVEISCDCGHSACQ